MSAALRIAVAGLGTVGAGVVGLLAQQRDLLAARAGRALDVTAVSARSRDADRGIDIAAAQWFDDAAAMAATAPADIVVELIGGADGPARAVVEGALAAGRHVVTANKTLMARHGTALARRAEDTGRALHYEAAVAGGIPIVKALREGLAANRVGRLYGILNGTCNYILTTMRESGRGFDDILAEAQALGYAEADPAMDVDGIDAAQKLALLASLAFGTEVDADAVHTEGIRRITPLDIAYADELGYRIKLLGIAAGTAAGLEQRVHPCMVVTDAPLAHVEGVFNAVVAAGDFVDDTLYEGRGAGAGPTASAVVADLVDIARGRRTPTFAVPATQLRRAPTVPMEDRVGACYVRLTVADRPGVIADIAAAFRDHDVSIEAMLQRGRSVSEGVPVVLTSHECREAQMAGALAVIGALPTVLAPPAMIRIEAL